MTARRLFVCLLAIASTRSPSGAQQPASQGSRPDAPVRQWRWQGTAGGQKYAVVTDYRQGGVYRLKKDVVVQYGGTGSRISQYWVSEHEPGRVAEVRECLRDPQAAKTREIQSLRDHGGTILEIILARHRSETRSILTAGTLLRFRHIDFQYNVELGPAAHPYLEVMHGALQGNWIDFTFVSRCDNEVTFCKLDPEFLEYLGQ
jgi:hypothetical protein